MPVTLLRNLFMSWCYVSRHDVNMLEVTLSTIAMETKNVSDV